MEEPPIFEAEISKGNPKALHIFMASFSSLANIGINNVITTREQKKVRVLNIAVWISLIHAAFFLLFELLGSSLNTSRIATLCAEIFIYSSVLFLQHRGWVNLARWSFIIAVFLNLFYHSNFVFKGFYGEYQYIVVALLSLIFFDRKIVHYSFLVASIAAFYLPNKYLDIYPDQYFGYLNVLFLFVASFYIVSYFKNQNDKNEVLLEKEKETVLKDKEMLEQQSNELAELNEFKSQFFINLAHEIRTPITLIKGYTNRINTAKSFSENESKLQIIKEQTNNIESIVNDLLDLSKLESNNLQLRLEQVDVSLFITKIYTDYKALFSEKNIDFDLRLNIASTTLELDINLFTKAIHNLLNNALKFTPEDGNVQIIVDQKEQLEISFIDSGIGIPAADLEKVFERFYQSKNHITASQGSGIGLSFAKNILVSHGFQLNVESEPEIQTRFTIGIPLRFILNNSNPSEIIGQTQVEVNSQSEKQRILIVEDHSEMRNYLKLVLSDFDVTEAQNGKEALVILENQSFDAIISDYMMPVMDGHAFIQELKNRQISTPVIVITARNDDKAKLNMLRLGVDAYMTKPFLEEELLVHLKHSLKLFSKMKKTESEVPDEERVAMPNAEQEFCLNVTRLIEEHLSDKSFGVDQLAELIQLSRSSLFRKTQQYFGQTPNELIGEARLQKAREILENQPNIRKKELADAVGVYNSTYFYNKLKNRFYV